jgi:hypothetical protein
MLTRADRLAVLIALAALPFVYHYAWSGSEAAPDEVEISTGEETIHVPLHPDREITVQGRLGPSHIELRDGGVRFVDSPCTGKLCVLSGWHRHTGEFAACLPNGVVVNVAGARSAYDAVNF